MLPTAEPDPAFYQHQVSNELRLARERAQKSYRDMAVELDCSTSKVQRIESGDVTVRTVDIKAFMMFCRVPEPRQHELVALAKAARVRSPWEAYRAVASRDLIRFAGLESSASAVHNFEPCLVPGLLQTEDYARTVIASLAPDVEVDGLVDLRMQRQDAMGRSDSRQFFFYLDEAVLHRHVGGTVVMRRQLARLRAAIYEDGVSVRIVPFKEGLYPHFRTPCVLFSFARYHSHPAIFIDDPEKPSSAGAGERVDASVRLYKEHFAHLTELTRTYDAARLVDEALQAR